MSKAPDLIFPWSAKNSVPWMLALVLGSVLVYFNSLHNDFTSWDDNLYVLDSELLTAPLWDHFTGLSASLYTPITTLSYALDYQLWGLDPFGFHLTSLLIHITTSVLVFLFIYRLTNSNWQALFVSLFFALHPMNVEAIAWISGRKDALSAFFYVLALLHYLKIKSSAPSLKNQLVLYILFLAACLSKPTALSLPIVLIALDYYLDRKIDIRSFLSKATMLLISIGFLGLGVYLVIEVKALDSLVEGYGFYDKVCIAAHSLVHYIYNGIVPTDLTNFHSLPHKTDGSLPAKYLVSPVIAGLFLWLAFKQSKKNTQLGFAILFFLVSIGPTLRFLPSGYPEAADRYFYLPSIGFGFVLVTVLATWLKEKLDLVFKVGSLIALVCLGVIAQARTMDWKNSLTLWKSAYDNDPTLYLALESLGKHFDREGQPKVAIKYYTRALKEKPDNAEMLNSCGVIFQNAGEFNRAIEYFNLALEADSSSELPFYNRGNAYKALSKHKLAIKDYNKAILMKPIPEMYNNRGASRVLSGDTLGAFDDFEKASLLAPDNVMFKDNFQRIKLLVQ